MNLLSKIKSPKDLRKLKSEQLEQVASELRLFLLETVAKKGGHLASNLGSTELTVALHYVFETPYDKLIWDVGHQSYGHKVLTGRQKDFETIRQYKGLSGFTSREESPYDPFGAGHASTAISAALGMAEALKFKNPERFAIAVVGDGSLTGGLSFEALNNAGHIPAKNLLVVLNDNEMSIDPNVGALSKFINSAQTHLGYNRLREEIIHLVQSITSETGLPLQQITSKVRKSVKNIFTPASFFECFGFRYLGPLNGHELNDLIQTFSFIKNQGPQKGPYFVHAITTKGRGYKLAEEMPVKYHGVNPFMIDIGIKSSPSTKLNYQDIFSETLVELAKKNKKIIAITAAMPSGTGLVKFQENYPDRFYDVGIAEAHAVLFAAGLSIEGFIPVCAIYSTFLQRAYDQVIHDVALQNLPVIFALDRAGLVGNDGATHQGTYDLTFLRAIPNMVVMAPKDENELRHMIYTATQYRKGPIAFRYPRGPVVGVPLDKELKLIPIGKAELVQKTEDPDIVIIAVGFAVQSALTAQTLLEEKELSVAIINARFLKPLDEELLTQWIEKSSLVVTVEENTHIGGLGSAVLELMAKNRLKKECLVIGMPDFFIDHASQAIQRELTKLDGPGIFSQILERWNFIHSKDYENSFPAYTKHLRNNETTKAIS